MIAGLTKKKKNVKLFLIFHILKERDVTYLPSHFHLIHFTDHSPSHSHSAYVVLLILHRISTSFSLSFFSQSCLWKLGVSLDKILIRNIYCIMLKLNSDGITTPCYLIRIATTGKRLQHRRFPVNIAKFLRRAFSIFLNNICERTVLLISLFSFFSLCKHQGV